MSKQGRDQNRTQRAAAVRVEQERKERNRRLALVVGIIVLLGAIVAGGTWYSSGGGTAKQPTGSTAAHVTASEIGLNVGDKSAPVKVVIYEDFQCPYCRELESSTRTFLRESAAKGKVYVEYVPINLLSQLPYSAKALNAFAAVLHGSTPKAALALHDLLYDNQPYEQDSAKVTDGQIAAWVKQAGADNPTVTDAMKTRDLTYFTVVNQVMASQGIRGTPTVLVDGKELPPTSVPDMVKAIEKAVGQGS
jgi:protein-disulfide isomerase